jgi:hypothetical protein
VTPFSETANKIHEPSSMPAEIFASKKFMDKEQDFESGRISKGRNEVVCILGRTRIMMQASNMKNTKYAYHVRYHDIRKFDNPLLACINTRRENESINTIHREEKRLLL